jgi:hypothetical protein
MVHGHREYTYNWGALFGFNVVMDVEADSTDCTIDNQHIDKTKIQVTQQAPGWEILSESEVQIEREEADRKSCTSSRHNKNKWDKRVAHGNVLVKYAPGVPYWTPWGSGTLSITIVTVKVQLTIILFPDNSTQLPPEEVTTMPLGKRW